MKTDNRKIVFSRRIPEPKKMDKIEMDVFESASKQSYKRWIIPLVDDALNHASPPKEAKILDIAGGPGFLAREFAKRSKKSHVFLVDISSYVLELAKKNCRGLKNITIRKASVYKLPFKDNFFDIVTCKDSFHHFNKPKEALREMLRVTKKGGVLYIQDLKRNVPQYLLRRVTPPKNLFEELIYYSTRASYTKPEIIKILKEVAPKSFFVKTRNLTGHLERHYKKIGIETTALKEGLQARYVAVARK